MKAKITFFHILCLGLLLARPLAPHAAAGAALIETLDTGDINWSAGTVRASGIGAPDTAKGGESADSPTDMLKAARRKAQANLLETLSAIRINASSRVADRMAQDAAFRDGLTAVTRNADVSRQEYLSDGTVEIELTMNLTGGFDQFVLPEEIRQVDSVTAVTAAESSAENATDSGPYTGLILDATGIDAKPSLVPVIVDESGEVVYGPAFVSREFAVSRGMSGFATTLTAARDDKRVGDQPMLVKAIRTRSMTKTDLVISNADAARLRSSAVHLNFMKACRVSIVMDPELDP